MHSEKVLDFVARSSALSNRSHLRSSPLSILSVGRDPRLLRLREQVICSRSDLVVKSLSPEQAENWIRSPAPYLWIFCNSVTLPQLVHLACTIRRFSRESRLLLLEGARPPGFERTLFHQLIPPLQGPECLLDAVSRLAVAI